MILPTTRDPDPRAAPRARARLTAEPARTEPGTCQLTLDDPHQVTRLHLTGSSALPLATGQVRAVHLSGILEQLDPAAALQLLLECHRVLPADGQLVLRLPDFDAALAAWRRGDLDFFAIPPDRPEQLDRAAAAWFCRYRPRAGGPWTSPSLPTEPLHALRDQATPMRLAIELCNFATETEPPIQLERQSAWSRAELIAMLRLVGFEVRRLDAAAPPAHPTDPGRAPVAPTMECLAELAPDARSPGATRFQRGLALARAGARPAGLRALAEATELDPALAARHYRLLWHLHAQALREAHPELAPSPTFATEGRHVGQVPAPLARALRDALARCPTVAVTAEDSAPGYLFNPNLSEAGLAVINRDNTYWAIDRDVLRALQPVLAHLAAPLRACLGTPWRVVNVRAWRTSAQAARVEANGWHRDEPYPPVVLKALLYLTEAGPDTGTTEVVRPDGDKACAAGPAGTFQIFKNAEMLHRGVPPRHGERWAVELTVAPHPVDDLRPVCAGQNADFPLCPWMNLEPWMPLSSAGTRPSPSTSASGRSGT